MYAAKMPEEVRVAQIGQPHGSKPLETEAAMASKLSDHLAHLGDRLHAALERLRGGWPEVVSETAKSEPCPYGGEMGALTTEHRRIGHQVSRLDMLVSRLEEIV